MKQYFHGANKRGPYFEGWYFKCQTREGDTLALIPAMHIGGDGMKSASVQVISEDDAWWVEYPTSVFSACRDKLDIQIGANSFSETGLELDLEQDGLSLRGTVHFGPLQELQSDIMGPFRLLGNMECAHSVISMAHPLQGELEINGQVLDYAGGIGYIESDRGRSFPETYLWTQCLWKDCSLMLSVATIPLGPIHFTGCICAIVLNGTEYRLATYRGVKIRHWSEHGVRLTQGNYRLEVQLLEQKPQPLHAPADGVMSRTVHESLCAKVRYRFWEGRALLFDRTAVNAGFEYGKTAASDNEKGR